jgi:hypothetical protein
MMVGDLSRESYPGDETHRLVEVDQHEGAFEGSTVDRPIRVRFEETRSFRIIQSRHIASPVNRL